MHCKTLTSIFLLSVLSFSCEQPSNKRIESLVASLPEGIECSTQNHKSIFQILLEHDRQQAFAAPRTDRQDYSKQLKLQLQNRIEKKSKVQDQKVQEDWAETVAELIVILDFDLRKLDQDGYENQIARVDYGSRITKEYEEISQTVRSKLDQAKSISEALELPCSYSSMSLEQVDESAPQVVDLISGLRWTMATAYQSCESLKIAPINSTTENVRGIKKKSNWGRSYEDLSLIKQTHPYLVGVRYEAGCFDVSKRPLVYDFGGSAGMKESKLDLFTNYNGGEALGIDCSAFASAAAATAGLLYVKNSNRRPIYSRWSTRDFVDPEASGWTCYSKVRVGPNSFLLPGDLAVIRGHHMVGIDSLGKNPFGFDSMTNIEDCNRIATRDLNFTLIQSASTKGSLGINRFDAASYLAESSELETLFLAYAKASCVAKFSGKSLLPSLTSQMSVIRHAGTEECKAKRIPLIKEECLKSCDIY